MIPGNEGRGYVLRRIARRAIRHGYKLGARKPFFHKLVAALVAEMGDAYPELRRAAGARHRRAASRKRSASSRPSPTAWRSLETALAALAPGQALTGDVAFKLHDTFGFPVDLTADVCRERGVTVDDGRLRRRCSASSATRARAAAKFKMAQGLEYSGGATTFHGYETLVHDAARVAAIYVDGSRGRARRRAGDDAVVVLDHTPFYAESGGQVGDTGELRNAAARMLVEDTIKVQAAVFGHQGRIVEGRARGRRRRRRPGRRRAARAGPCATTAPPT